jgi:PAS domain S-box-containing protein
MTTFILLSGLLLVYIIYSFFLQRFKNEKRFRILIESSSDIIALLDKNMLPIYRSPSAEKVTGFTESDRKQGVKIEEIHPDDRDLMLLKIEEINANPGKAVTATYRMKHKDGHYIWLEGSFTNLFHEPRVKAILVNMRDITEQKANQLQQLLLQSIVNSSDDAIISKTLLGIITSWNPGAEKILGYRADEMIGKHIDFIIPEHLRDEERSIIENVTGKGPVHQYETERVKKDGSIINVSLNVSLVITPAGHVIGISKILRDVTEKKRSEKIIEEANLERNIILESIADGFFAVDKNWVVTYWNKVAEKNLTVPKSSILGYKLWDVFSESIDSYSYLQYHKAMEEKSPAHFEDYFLPLEKWFEISAYPSANGLSVYFKDITSRKFSELQSIAMTQDLLQKSKELAASNNELEQFAYVASHDMQEPLRMVTGFLSQLEKKYGDVIDDKGRQYIDFAMDGAKRMRRIILDLLEFSVIGRKEEQKEVVDLNELIQEIKTVYAKEIAEKNAQVVPEELPVIQIEKSSVYRIFQNLIGNALKYSKEGAAPVIRIFNVPQNDYWEFGVSDNGIGIDKDYFDKIFVIFQRLNTDNKSGTGIGLAVCKKIAEQHGGSIRVESVEGNGSTFYFTMKK